MTETCVPRRLGERGCASGWPASGSMGRNHLRVLRGPADVPTRGRRRPGADALGAAVAPVRRAGFAEPLAMLAEAGLDAVVVAAPDHAPPAARPGGDRAGHRRSSSRSRWRPRWTRRRGSSPRPRPAACPVQVGHIERFNPAVLELGRLLERRLADAASTPSEPAGRPVPGAHPRRRRDRRPGHPRRRHHLAGSPASGPAASTPSWPSASTPSHEDLLFGLLPSRRRRAACWTSTG